MASYTMRQIQGSCHIMRFREMLGIKQYNNA